MSPDKLDSIDALIDFVEGYVDVHADNTAHPMGPALS